MKLSIVIRVNVHFVKRIYVFLVICKGRESGTGNFDGLLTIVGNLIV